MKDEKCEKVYVKNNWHQNGGGTFGWFYFLGIIGSAVYFLQGTIGFWPGVLAILKAFVWPAFIVYEVFQLLKI